MKTIGIKTETKTIINTGDTKAEKPEHKKAEVKK